MNAIRFFEMSLFKMQTQNSTRKLWYVNINYKIFVHANGKLNNQK